MVASYLQAPSVEVSACQLIKHDAGRWCRSAASLHEYRAGLLTAFHHLEASVNKTQRNIAVKTCWVHVKCADCDCMLLVVLPAVSTGAASMHLWVQLLGGDRC
jgi:hypothetical protein